MTEARKPARTQEVAIDIDAPIEQVWRAVSEAAHLANWFSPRAEMAGAGEGAAVTLDFGDGISWTTKVDAFQPNKLLRWTDNADWLTPGAVLHVEFQLSTDKGMTVLKLVQSGFGESEGWDGFFAGTEAGWACFVNHLKRYVELHFDRARQMISTRFSVELPRDVVWNRLLTAAGGLVVAGSGAGNGAIMAGDELMLQLTGSQTVRALVDVVVRQRAIGFRIAELDNAMLMVELEPGDSGYHIGVWLSVYDAARAEQLRQPVLERIQLIRAALTAG